MYGQLASEFTYSEAISKRLSESAFYRKVATFVGESESRKGKDFKTYTWNKEGQEGTVTVSIKDGKVKSIGVLDDRNSIITSRLIARRER